MKSNKKIKKVGKIGGTKVYKQIEFNEFIKMIKDGVPVESWKSVADDLGVDTETLLNWKKTPEYIHARKKVLEQVIKNMKKAGIKDWRMHDRLLKLHGIDAVDLLDVTSKGKSISTVKTEDNKFAKWLKEQNIINAKKERI